MDIVVLNHKPAFFAFGGGVAFDHAQSQYMIIVSRPSSNNRNSPAILNQSPDHVHTPGVAVPEHKAQ